MSIPSSITSTYPLSISLLLACVCPCQSAIPVRLLTPASSSLDSLHFAVRQHDTGSGKPAMKDSHSRIYQCAEDDAWISSTRNRVNLALGEDMCGRRDESCMPIGRVLESRWAQMTRCAPFLFLCNARLITFCRTRAATSS